MRVNEPITDHEVEVPEGEPLVSRTDRGGTIVFANHVFVEMSGFTEQELIGSPHNIVRHPLMPQEAFANLWATIKAGRPWDGLVKNRAKTGDFYWVRANVTPVIENGEVTGYISIRSKPTRPQIDRAERAYADIRAGKAKGIALADGEVVPRGALASAALWARSVRGRLLAVMVAALVAVFAVGWLGFSGIAASNDALRHVYDHDLVAVNQLRSIVDRVRDNRNHIAQMTIALGRGTPAEQVLGEREPPVRANMNKISELWRAYRSGELTAEQRPLVEKFDNQYAALVSEVIDPAFALARRGEKVQLNASVRKAGAGAVPGGFRRRPGTCRSADRDRPCGLHQCRGESGLASGRRHRGGPGEPVGCCGPRLDAADHGASLRARTGDGISPQSFTATWRPTSDGRRRASSTT